MSGAIDTKNIGNTIYHSAVLAALVVGYGMAAKIGGIGDPSKADMMEALKLTGVISLAIITKGYLEKQGLPADIMKG